MNRHSLTFYLPSLAFTLIFPCMLFCFDTFYFALTQKPCLHTLASLTLVLSIQSILFPMLFICYLFLGLFSFITTSLVTTYLIFISSIFLITKYLSLYSTHTNLLCYIASSLITVVPLISNQTPLSSYWTICTIGGITGNLITVYFSLKWSPAVKRGNRF